MDGKDKRDNNLICCIVCGAIAFIFNAIAFVSPYWIVGREGIQKEFVKLGLWESCFDNYFHPQDYVSKKYSGCWYIYWPEYDYIRDWLNPPWFYAVQMMAILSLICNVVALMMSLLKFVGTLEVKDKITNVTALLVDLVGVWAYLVVIISMGVMSKDRNWLPRPDLNYLSWSFGFAVIGAFFTLFCFFTLYIHYIIHNLAPEFKSRFKPHEVPLITVRDATLNKSYAGSVSGVQQSHTGVSNIYSQGGKSAVGTTSGATASAKVREAMLQKKNPYGGSVASLNSLGQPKNNAGSSHNLMSKENGKVMVPMDLRNSMSSLHSNYRSKRNNITYVADLII